jgi:hypothetical protein
MICMKHNSVYISTFIQFYSSIFKAYLKMYEIGLILDLVA